MLLFLLHPLHVQKMTYSVPFILIAGTSTSCHKRPFIGQDMPCLHGIVLTYLKFVVTKKFPYQNFCCLWFEAHNHKDIRTRTMDVKTFSKGSSYSHVHARLNTADVMYDNTIFEYVISTFTLIIANRSSV
jgi:hypothetical protein